MITWNEVETHWNQFKPRIHTRWEKLTETDLTRIKGNRDTLLTQLESRYNIPRTDAQRQVDEFLKSQPAAAKK